MQLPTQSRRTASTAAPRSPQASAPTTAQHPSGEAVGHKEDGTESSQDHWGDQSPTSTLGPSSPELPPLPALPSLRGLPRTPSRDRENKRKQKAFVTASWGSPYQRPPPGDNDPSSPAKYTWTPSNKGSSEGEEEDDEEEEGDESPEFGLEHLLPSRLPPDFQLTPTGPSLAALSQYLEQTPRAIPFPSNFAESSSRSNESYSKALIDNFLEGHWNSERGAWWSDESASEAVQEKEVATFETPSAKRRASLVPDTARVTRKGHRSKDSNLTLKPEDFLAIVKAHARRQTTMFASKYADSPPESATPADEAPDEIAKIPPQPLEQSPTVSKTDGTPPAESKVDQSAAFGTDVVSLEKALPLPPADPEVATATPSPPPAPEASSVSVPGSLLRTDTSTSLPPGRARKTVLVNGKKCIISIPLDENRGKEGGPPIPLSKEEVESRLDKFQQAGFDTRGFQNGSVHSTEQQVFASDHAQNREIFVPEEQSTPGAAKLAPVSIPDKKKWLEFMDYLTEQKLAALGVSVGEDEPALPPEPTPSQIMRVPSQQYPPLPFSPPPPSASANSFDATQNSSSVVTPFAHGPTPISGHRSNSSVASPITAAANAYAGSHMHRHSVFGLPGMPHQSSSPGLTGFSPQQFINKFGVARGGSPAIAGSRSDLAGMISPSPPPGLGSRQASFGQPGGVMGQTIQQQQEQQQRQLQQQIQAIHQQQQKLQRTPSHMLDRPVSNLAGVPEDEAEQAQYDLPTEAPVSKSTTEIAVPTPRGHRHNISENLEREIQAAEDYHLEKSIDKQLDEDGDFDLDTSYSRNESGGHMNGHATSGPADRQAKIGQPASNVLYQPQPHNRAHSITNQQSQLGLTFNVPSSDPVEEELSEGIKTNPSDFETNPSDGDDVGMGFLGQSKHAFSGSQTVAWDNHLSQKSSHQPSSSITQHASFPSGDSRYSSSKLNVEAKEFKFNPTASFNPMSSFDPTASFNPASFKFNAPALQSSHGAKPSVSQFSKSVGFSSAPQKQTGFGGSTFGFNVAAPSFQPSMLGQSSVPTGDFSFSSASTFQPSGSAGLPKFTAPASDAAEPSNKIFSNINLQDVVMPTKKSKAVPIIRPDQLEKVDEDVQPTEGADGRVTQDDARFKRARRAGDDGDTVPQFADIPEKPSHPLGENFQSQSANQSMHATQDSTAHGKENRSPQRTIDLPSPVSPLTKEEQANGSSPVKDFYSQHFQDLSFGSSRNVTTLGERSANHDGHSFDQSRKVMASQDIPKAHKKNVSSLSGAAKPFEFKPRGQTPSFGHDLDPLLLEKDLTIDSIASNQQVVGDDKTSPTTFINSQFADTENVDLASFNHPTFNEINAVIQHMEQAGSDFGIERDNSAWNPQASGTLEEEVEGAPDGSSRQIFASAVQGDSMWPDEQPDERQISREEPDVIQDPFDDEHGAVDYQSPIRKLNEAGNVAVSDWDDVVLSSQEEDRFQSRSRFFDSHVEKLIDSALRSRLDPLHKTLNLIQEALPADPTSREALAEASRKANVDSDADDEDDESTSAEVALRNRSPLRRDRKMEQIRNAVSEALVNHQPGAPVQAASQIDEILKLIKEAIPSRDVRLPDAPHEDLRTIIRETLAEREDLPRDRSLSDTTPDIKTLIAEAFASHQPLVANHDEIRTMIQEALASQGRSAPDDSDASTGHYVSPEDFYAAMTDLKLSVARSSPSNLLDDVKTIIEASLKDQQLRLPNQEEDGAVSEAESSRAMDREKAVQDANARADDEAQLRRELEDRHANADRSLRLAEEELRLMRETSRDQSQKLRGLEEESHITRMNIAVSQGEKEELAKKNSDLTFELAALQTTLDEHSASAKKWRHDMDQSHQEKEELKNALSHLRMKTEEALRIREQMRTKLDRLQQDMAAASNHVASEKAGWHRRDEEHRKRYEVLTARIEAEARTRERLEKELDRLENQEREFMRMRVTLEQTQHHNDRLEQTVARLRQESMEHQKNAHRLQGEFREAREAGRLEVERTRILMEAEIEAANTNADATRVDFEAALTRAQVATEHAKQDAQATETKLLRALEEEVARKQSALEDAQQKHNSMLDQEAKAKRDSLREATEERSRVLYQQRQKHDQTLDDTRKQHTRELQIATEDKERLESSLNERLQLSDSKVEHLEDKVRHLEERLEVSKSAAQAAVQAAQTARSPSGAEPAPEAAAKPAGPPEKISPQALRESIAVLQEQLQERESRIDDLQQNLDAVDKEAPSKLKERDIEVGWLRELLGVRVDDISELINTLSQPHFERDKVRDAAIRIRTNLQMEQHEKERLISRATGGNAGQVPPLPNLASSISNFASPKAVQLAAALGNWRKGKDAAVSNLSQFAAAASQSARSSAVSSPTSTYTPSRRRQQSPRTSSGLMTPPTSNFRRTPSASAQSSQTLAEEMGWSAVSTPRQGSKQSEKLPMRGPQAPTTPPLMRKGSYDHDADGVFVSAGQFEDDFPSDMIDSGDAIAANDDAEAGASGLFGPGLSVQ